MTDADPITAALRRAKAAWTADRFPGASAGNSPTAEVGTEKAKAVQPSEVSVPTVPTVPKPRMYGHVSATMSEACAAWEERAAVLEFDGGLTRQQAERAAAEEVLG